MSGLNLLSRPTPGFPPVDRALEDPNGLLAVGGDLSPEWLITAYRNGIFPWFDEDDGPVLWWCPDPRAVVPPDAIRITRSLSKRLRNGGFTVSFDTRFADVIDACADFRARGGSGNGGTWITDRMRDAYVALHDLGLAHSVEVWLDGDLVGGLYGVSLGRMFYGESMFSRVPDASKVALCHLCRQLDDWDFWLVDCQVSNPHLTTLGAVEMPRAEFMTLVERNAHQQTRIGPWQLTRYDPTSWTRS